ncbi:GyrI-like domain-containing protein [Actinomadura xylanilytica]|uniref:GyrI-like domain-containing protein n=1 Tax=Actinomadura xylanilytica TaxID=887459 RepID=UPI00255B2958|nr:GyrI-like domain-containing protein [Actinomadura xylanilytica]MDL4773315.1 GyrI-like domain-containing protein [Actinomadura xylanilytica]
MNRYEAAEEPEFAEFGPVGGLGVTGRGEPGGPAFTAAVGALYAVAGAAGIVPPPLEGRWWVEDGRPPLDVPRGEWWWHLFLHAADGMEPSAADRAREAVLPQIPAAARVQFVTFTEGRCVQMLHRGPFSEEPRSLARMDALMEAEGLVPNGLHHEIYLSDPREVAPEKARTILRRPVRPAAT